MFDAGAIEARLTIDPAQFNRDMDAAEARVKRFEDGEHKVKVSAVFDNASLSKAKKAFTDLDNQISREAMNRLRSSPQGSVLGALNALFSPHQVSGGPTASQAAQQGLLGKIVSSPGGGGVPGPVNTRSQNTVSQILGTNGSGNTNSTNTVRTNVVGAPGNTNTTDRVTVLGAPTNNSITTKDRVDVTGLPTSGGSITTKVKTKLDPGSAAATEAAATASGDRAGKGWAGSFLSNVKGLFGGGGGNGSQAGAVSKLLTAGGDIGTGGQKNLAAGTIGGALPGILGLGTKATGIVGLGGSLLGAVPALLGGVSPLIPAAAGAGALGLLFAGAQKQISPVSQAISAAKAAQGAAQTPAQATAANQQLAGANAQLKALSPGLQSIYQSEQQIGNWWQAFTGKFAPMFAGPLKQVASLLTGLTGPLNSFFKSAFTLAQPLIAGIGDLARQWLPLLAQGFRAAAPVIRPLIDGIGSLVTGLLPGLNTLVKASAPAVAALGHVFGELGGSLGQMLAIFAPVLSQSSVILKALFDVINALFPIIGQLAAIFATALAPVFVQFAGVVKALLPFLTLIGNVLASLAGAVLSDLVSAFGALAQLLTGIAPSLTVFAKALSNVFNVLENTGVFAILGNAVENLVGPLAKLINALIAGLVPVLPPIINFIGQLSSLIATTLSNAIATLLPPLTKLALSVLQVLAAVLPVILPLLLTLAGIFTTAVVAVISGVATALADVINALPPSVLDAIVLGVTGLVLALKGMAAVSALSGGLGFLTTLRLLPSVVSAAASSLVRLGVQYAVTAAEAVAGAAVQIASWVATAAAATAAFIAENIAMLGIGVAIAALIAAIVYMATHWQQVWTDIKNWTDDAWKWLNTNIFDPMGTFFTKTLPGWWSTVITALKAVFVTPFELQFKAAWDWVNANVWTPVRTFFTVTLPGYWDSAIAFLGSHFVTPFQNGLKAAYNWVVTNVATPIETLFTKTMPGWFNTAVSAISGFWGRIEGVVMTPVKFVVDNVLDPLINLFDDVTNAVGLGKPIPTIKLAGGGRLPGFGGGDILPALLEPGEAVVDKDTTRQYAWLLKMIGVPGFAAGGVAGGPTPVSGRGGALGGVNPTGGNVLSGVINSAVDMAKAIAAIATGNPTALANAVIGMFGGSSSGGMGGVVGKALLGLPAKLIGDFAHWIIGTSNIATSQAGGGASLHPTGAGATVQALMQSMAASVGWTGAQWSALNSVEMAEAGYNLTAQNPTSNAYGLAQFINGPSEYAAYGGNSTTAAGQITAMLNYIAQRYGNPAAAWQHELDFGWYDKGGWLQPGYTLAHNASGRPEQVIPHGEGMAQSDALAMLGDKLDKLIAVTGAVPAGVGAHVGGALNDVSRAASFNRRYPRGGA